MTPGEWRPAPRQTQVIQLVCEGRTLDQVAATMSCSVGTVKGYLGKIYNRLGFRYECECRGFLRLKLLKWAIKNKVVSL